MVYLREIGESSSMKKRRLIAKDGVRNEEYSGVGHNYGAGRDVGYQKWCEICHRVKEILQLFRETLRKLQQENRVKLRIERTCSFTDAADVIKKKGKWLHPGNWFGVVPGVEIGDEFRNKAELKLIGLHNRRFCGIDYLKWRGNLLATSVVVTNVYANNMESSDVLVYVGEGGNPRVKNYGKLKDQKLERGNLALKNCIDHKTPVRVIRCHEPKGAECVYVYEGLYLVECFWQDRGEFGKLVFKFQMRKLSRLQRMSKHVTRDQSKKIFNHNGKSPIRKKVTRDIGKASPLGSKSKTIAGCDCVHGCSEFEDCSCKVKNGGKLPYDYTGDLVRKMLINECGPSCKCPPSCMNRVTQRGTRARLELFKDKFSRYGVRSKSYISKGSFICKFEPRKRFYGKEKPGEINDVAMDVSRDPNVGRYINYSSSPNLYCEKVIIGEEDEPHMMLFAMRNISPSEELTIGIKNQVLNSK